MKNIPAEKFCDKTSLNQYELARVCNSSTDLFLDPRILDLGNPRNSSRFLETFLGVK